jgi:succinate-semialdehyde dehydrogenase/glutarate-semialdehyde dehydrogenase
MPFRSRADLLLAGRDNLLANLESFVQRLCAETGKVRGDALADLMPLCDTIGYFAKHGERILSEEPISAHLIKHKKTRVAYHPRGVVVNISPWNFPVDLSLTPAMVALLAGNVVLLKPSEVTPSVTQFVAEFFYDAGLPRDVLQILPGYGATGAALIEHADQVLFTGSVATGRRVAEACARRLIPYTLELGGKDPAIVLPSADLTRTAAGIVWGAFMNCGQICMSVERVYAVEPIAAPLIERIVDLTLRLRQGADVSLSDSPACDVGSMTSPQQLAIVEAHVQDARERGAKILTGGHRLDRPGHWYAPTVLADVTHDMRIMREETFGPILPIMSVPTVDEAIRLANDSEFGLSSSVWGRDLTEARTVARQIEAGSVNINDVFAHYSVLEAPFYGLKHSGVGGRHSADELRKYCYPQSITEDRFNLKREPFWYPYSQNTSKTLLSSLRLLFSREPLTARLKHFLGR